MAELITVSAEDFNDWMEAFTKNPGSFSREWEEVWTFLSATAVGREPDYGDRCIGYLRRAQEQREVQGHPDQDTPESDKEELRCYTQTMSQTMPNP